MTDENPLAPVIELLNDINETPGWLRCTFGQPIAPDADWQKLVAQPIAVAQGMAIKVVHTLLDDGQRTHTVQPEEWPGMLAAILGQQPRRIELVGRRADYHARFSKSGRWLVSRGKPSIPMAEQSGVLPGHDRAPNHPLPPAEDEVRQLFIETGLFGLSGQLRGVANGKYRQVQHYLELLRPLAALDPEAGLAGQPLRIVDAGCGKAYLSLGLYLFARRLGFDVSLLGIDRNAALVKEVRRIAARLGYTNATFEAATIDEIAERGGEADLLVSLHACDTATDDAIAAGLALHADAVVLAPCCHHEVVQQIDTAVQEHRAPAGFEAVTRSPVLRRRFAELVTDGLRASALEARGYRADLMEFISPEHTLRNLMIRAEKRPPGSGLESAKATGRAVFVAQRDQWGLQPSVERVLADA